MHSNNFKRLLNLVGVFMNEKVDFLIRSYINEFSNREDVHTRWKDAIVRFADANDSLFYNLRSAVSSTHAMPKDFLDEAETVIVYFIPFTDEINKSNIKGRECSEEWARAYVESNKLMQELNQYLADELEDSGYKSYAIPGTYNFDTDKLISDWSQRHVAYIAGLGSFGLNNMMITEKGCCGRIGSIVTSLKLEPSNRLNEEYCLYKKNGKCKACVRRCVNNALKVDEFVRNNCYDICLENDKKYSYLGLCDICGKCTVGVPCSTKIPYK
jgi:epoxyqueuosine reductase QueG